MTSYILYSVQSFYIRDFLMLSIAYNVLKGMYLIACHVVTYKGANLNINYPILAKIKIVSINNIGGVSESMLRR